MGAIALVLRPLAYDNPLATIAPVTLILVVIGSWITMRQHDRGLCEDCMAAMPLNTSELAVRYRKRFSVAHLGARKKLAVTYLLVLLASNFVLLSWDVLPYSLGKYVWAALQTTMIYLLLSYSTHRRLQPWCPECSGGGGGGDRTTDAPDPIPTGAGRY
jgi:hypothetical protein